MPHHLPLTADRTWDRCAKSTAPMSVACRLPCLFLHQILASDEPLLGEGGIDFVPGKSLPLESNLDYTNGGEPALQCVM